jgi:hypothetical protein
MSGKRTLLVVAAHMDDAWLGVGGLALDAVRKGHHVVFINTVGDYANWPVTQGREDELKGRVRELAESRGIEIRFLDYAYEHVPDTPECMAQLAAHCDDIAPDFLFCHWADDTNLDHVTTGRAAAYGCMHAPCFLRRSARTPHQVFAFQGDSQCRGFSGSVYHDIGAALPEVLRVLAEIDHLYAQYQGGMAVRATVDCRVTGEQFDLTNHGAQKYALAVTRGAECGVMYAECYHALSATVASRVLSL